jgi:hypothetical protein
MRSFVVTPRNVQRRRPELVTVKVSSNTPPSPVSNPKSVPSVNGRCYITRRDHRPVGAQHRNLRLDSDSANGKVVIRLIRIVVQDMQRSRSRA